MSRYGTTIYHSELKHHGILGMKWGVRRYQNEDGSLTEAGKQRYLTKYGILKFSTPDEIRRAYNDYEHRIDEQRKRQIPDPPKVTSKQIDEIIDKIKINNKSLPKEYQKWFGYSDVDEWLDDNLKNYADIDWERRSDIDEKVIAEIEKRGYYFYD